MLSKVLDRLRKARRRNAVRQRKNLYQGFEVLEDRRMLTAGALDTSFSDDGTVTTNIGGSTVPTSDRGQSAVAYQSDGKVLVVGSSSLEGSSANVDFAVTRYTEGGELDSSFGVGGIVTIDFGFREEGGTGIAIDNADRIVVSGYSRQANTGIDFAVARLTADGALDDTFSDDGKRTIDFGGLNDFGYDIVVDSADRILVGGTSIQGGTKLADFAVARLNVDGTLDDTFADDGRQTIDFGDTNDGGLAIIIDSANRILVSGYSSQSGTTGNDFAVTRLNVDGMRDDTFADDGRQLIDFGDTLDIGYGVTVDSADRVLISGVSYQSGARGSDFAVTRLSVDGTPDDAFSGDGRQLIDFGDTYDDGRGVTVDSADRALVSGWSDQGGTRGNDFAVTRLNVDGTADNTFSGDGRQLIDFGDTSDSGLGVLVDSANRVLVSGYSDQGGTTGEDFAVARLIGGIDPILVTSTLDTVDTADGVITLREAILEANANTGHDTIQFDIGGGGPQTIVLADRLPYVTDPVTIDGSSQPGFAGTQLISVDAAAYTGTEAALRLRAGNSTVQDIALINAAANAIMVDVNGGNLVSNVDVSWNGATTMGNGINVNGVDNNTIRYVTATNRATGIHLSNSDGNTVANNIVTGASFGGGVQLAGNSDGNIIRGNDASGSIWGIRALNNTGQSNRYLDNNLSATSSWALIVSADKLFEISGNDFSGSGAGVFLSNMDGISVTTANLDASLGTVTGAALRLDNVVNSTIEDLDLSWAGADSSGTGLQLNGGSSNTIQNITATNRATGIRLDNSDANAIQNISASWTSTGQAGVGIRLNGGSENTAELVTAMNRGTGILLSSSDGNTIANNIVTGASFGGGVQVVGNSDGNIIQSNDASGSFWGIRAIQNTGQGNRYLDNNLSATASSALLVSADTLFEIRGNDFSGSGAGVFLSNMDGISVTTANMDASLGTVTGTALLLDNITNSTIEGLNLSWTGADSSGTGIQLSGASSNTIQDVTVMNRATGIRLDNANNNTLHCSTIANNHIGIQAQVAVAGLVVSENRIAENEFGMVISSPEPVNAEANFWGALDGPSTLGGAGDSFSGNVDAEPFRYGLPACFGVGFNAGGPYQVDEGNQVQLNLKGHPGVDISSLQAEWDLDYDGVNFDVDASGLTAIFDATSLDDEFRRMIGMTVYDAIGVIGRNTSSVTVNNVAPTVQLDPVSAIDENGVATLTGTIVDPGTQDTLSLDVNWGDPLNPGNVQQVNLGLNTTDAIDYLATDFDVAEWEDWGAATTYTASEVVTGGNPGSYRRVDLHLESPDLDGASGSTFHVNTSWTYDPATQGAIDSVDFEIDVINHYSPKLDNRFGATIRQDGKVYVAPGVAIHHTVWESRAKYGLQESDFALVGAPTVRPDFSANGGPIELGFYSVAHLKPGTAAGVHSSGFDNLKYTVNSKAKSFSLTHQYSDDGLSNASSDDYSVSVTVTDDDAGSGTADATVTVNNVAPAFVVTDRTTELVSGSELNVAGNALSHYSSISADGRYVAFDSAASDLVPGDVNFVKDIFVRDTQTGLTTLVSTDSSGNQGFGSSSSPSISRNGRYVAFYSSANTLVSGDTNGKVDVFVKDLLTGATTRVSTDSSGTQSNNNAFEASISDDGRFVAFYSNASNLTAGDINNAYDVFVKDMQTGVTTLVSTDSSGHQGLEDSIHTSISADGRYVAFRSQASNLVTGDLNSKPDVFVKDLQTGITTLASSDINGVQGNNLSDSPSISSDGRYVAFASDANNLVTGDTNGDTEIFVKDLLTGTTIRVSTDSVGNQGNDPSYEPSISSDGRYVAFRSHATNLVDGDTNGQRDIFVKDLQTGVTTLLSNGSNGVQSDGPSSRPSISGDGTRVTFSSDATNLPGGASGFAQVFVSAPAGLIDTTGEPFVEGTSIDVTAVATDPAGANDTLTYSYEVFRHANGQVQFPAVASDAGVDLTSFSFIPADDGDYDVVVTVSDEDGGSTVATQTVTVNNVAPLAGDDTYEFREGFGASILTDSLLSNDTDPGVNDVLTVTAFDSTGTVGLVTFVGGVLRYDPNGQFESLAIGEMALDTFTYTASDGTATDTGTVTITITGENDAPTANSDTYEARESSGVSILTDSLLSNDTDPDTSDILNVTAIDSTGTIGLVSFVDGVVRYDLNGQFESLAAGETATDTFAYTVSDGTATDTATVTFTIIGENDAPTASAGADQTVNEGDLVSIDGSFADPDATDAHTFLWRVSVGNGQEIADGTNKDFSFSPGDNGVYTLTYTVTDDHGAVGTDTVTITVNNVAPAASVAAPTYAVEQQVVTVDLTASDVPADEAAGFTYVVDWGDGQTDMIVATANNGVGVYATHVYSAAAVHDIVVTATDKDGGVGSVVHKINVAEISTEGLQNVIDETVASGEDAVIELEATSNSDLGSIIGSASQLTVDSGTFDIVVDMDGGNFHGQSINLPSGVNLVLQDGSLEGASPALTVTAGNVVVTGVTFTNVTDAPTILVHGGHLTLRGSTVEETTGGNQAGIEITGGTVDLGSTADPGANTFVVHQTGQAIRNTGSAMVTSIGNAFQGNDGISVTNVTSPFDIEDQIQHALDAGAGGVVEYVVDNVYVTQQSGSIQRGVDAVVGGGTVHVQQGNFAAYDAGDKLLTLAFQAGPVVRQEQDTLDASLRTVVVTGTNQDDNIHFGQGKASGAVDVSVNGVATGRFQPTGRLVAFGQAGNDDIQVTGGTVLSAWLYGDAGNDRLKGGAGHDAIFGGDGDDLLIGKSGRDLMIGGAGADRIIGNADDDILIAGATTFDLVAGSHSNVAHEQSIFDVMAEWTSDRDYEIRVANLTGDDSATADRQNGDTFLNAATVSDDDEKDVLTGSAGSDWFFMDAQQDRATDLKDEIFANDLDFILS